MPDQLPKAYLRIDPNIDQTRPDLADYVRLMCAANRQPRRGRFKSLAVVAAVVGRAKAKRYLEQGDLVQVEGGALYLDGWDHWQEGDVTVGDRVRRLRAKRSQTVTQPLQPPLPDRISPSEALGDRRRDTEKAPTTRTQGKNGAGSPSRPTAHEPRLTKDQLEAWRSFAAPQWRAFKSAWLGRGFLWPPAGEDGDDDTTQRGLLWQIADARPSELGAWVRLAPGSHPREVIDYVLTRWHQIREDVGLEETEAKAVQARRRDAPQRAGAILDRLATQVEERAAG